MADRPPTIFEQQLNAARRADGSTDLAVLAGLVTEVYAQSALELEQTTARLGAVMENMVQGVCLYNDAARLVASNRRYAEIYDLGHEDGALGTRLPSVASRRHAGDDRPDTGVDDDFGRRDTQLAPGPSDERVMELQNGRIVAVRHRAIPEGGWVATHEDVTAFHHAERRAGYLANHDGATHLPNAARLTAFLRETLSTIAAGSQCALLWLSLRRFSQINDTMGRAAGADLIRQVADRLRRRKPADAFLAHADCHVFAIVMTDACDMAATLECAAELLRAMEEPFIVGGESVVLSADIGIGASADSGSDPEALISHATLALQDAKKGAPGSYRRFAPEMTDATLARHEFERDLRDAVAAMAFEVHYQPQVNLATRRVSGFEALLRWRHPERGETPPADFIPLAEELGLIGPIGQWVLEQACRAATAWPDEISVAVNVSPRQFESGDLAATVATALRESGLLPSRLELEITESLLLERNAATLATLNDLRASGVRIAIDDFGVGYSSLAYLANFPFDKLKIDRSFVSGTGRRQDCLAIVRAITGLCANLVLTCAAEGVETEEQLATVTDENCTEAQGYLFSPALAASRIPEFLHKMHAPCESPAFVRPMPRLTEFSFRDIVETANDVVIVTTADTDPPGPLITYVNPAFTRLTGYSAAEVIGLSPRFLQGPGTDRGTLRDIRAGLHAGRMVHETVLNFAKSGAPYWLDLRIAPLRNDLGCITHFAAIQRDVTMNKRRLDELEFMADRDTLTGIPNRRALLRKAEAEIETARARNTARLRAAGPCMAFIDVDHFKRVNDTFGHAAGDAALFGLADRLAENVRRSDTLGRIGGEEFAVCMPGVTLSEATALAERLRRSVAEAPLELSERRITLTISIGVAAFDQDDTLARLMERADAALYAAKSGGRDRVSAITRPVPSRICSPLAAH